MRNVLKSTAEVAHFWANKVQPSGRAASVLFDGDTIYSYGKHFPMARHIAPGAVALTTRGYSVTTTRHLQEVRAAVRHLRVVHCEMPTETAYYNRNAALRDINTALVCSEKPRIRTSTRDGFKAQALAVADRFNAYLAALPEDERVRHVPAWNDAEDRPVLDSHGDNTYTRVPVEPIDTSSLEQVRANTLAAEVAKEQVRKQECIARRAGLLESLNEWRAGVIVARTGLHELPPALRLSADGSRVQTSWGAEVSVDDARLAWRLVRTAQRTGRDVLADVGASPNRIGDYPFNRAGADGTLVIGCHSIPAAEVQAFAATHADLFDTVAA